MIPVAMWSWIPDWAHGPCHKRISLQLETLQMALFPQAWASQGIQLVLGEMEAREPVSLVFFLLQCVGMSNGLQGLLRNMVEIAWRTSVHLILAVLHAQLRGIRNALCSAFHWIAEADAREYLSNSRLLPSLAFVSCEAFSMHSPLPRELHTSSALQALCLLHGSSSTGWNNTWRQLRADSYLHFLSCLLQPTQPHGVRVFKHLKKKSPLLLCDTESLWLESRLCHFT